MRILILVSLGLILASSMTLAQVPDVELSLTVSDGAGGTQELKFGLDPVATDTIDTPLGEAELPPPPPIGVFDTRFIGSDIAVEIGQGLVKDYRQGDSTTVGTRVHEILYQVGTGTAITVSWGFPETVEGRLQDIITGDIVDTVMAGSGSYTVVNPGAISKLKMTVTYSFTAPSAPVLVSPPNGTVVQDDSVQVTWSRSTPAVSRYWCEIATDSLFNFRVADSSATDTVYTFTGLTNNSHWWRVKAGNAYGWGPFSEAWKIVVSIVGVEEERGLPRAVSLKQNYPNPFNPRTTFQFDIPDPSIAVLDVYNMLGEKVATLVDSEVVAGSHTVAWDATNMPSGLYLYRLKTGTFVATRKMVLVK
jgi:hypothetical protein